MKLIPGGLLIFLLIFSVAQPARSQNRPLDSLRHLLQHSKADTNRIRILFEMTDIEGETNIDSAFSLITRAEELAQRQARKNWLAQVYITKGLIFYRQSLDDRALYYYLKGSKLFADLHDPEGTSEAINRIALVYKRQKNYTGALALFNQSLEIGKKMHDLRKVSITLNNIGTVYEEKKELQTAQLYYFRSYRIDSATHDLDGISKSAFNIGFIYDQLGRHSKAMAMYSQSLAISRAMNDKWEIADTYYYIALSADQNKDLKTAFKFGSLSMDLADSINSKELLQRVHKLIAHIYEEKGEYRLANEILKNYVKDFQNEFESQTSRSVEDIQHKYELENKEIRMEKARLLQEAKLAGQSRMLRVQWFFITAIVLILLLTLTLVFVLYKNQQQKQASLLNLTRLNYRVKLLNENLESLVEERTGELTETKENLYQLELAQIRKEERLKTEFNKQVAEAELKALRAQMNPHFIFNCLNSINGYIVKNDPIKASSYLSKFAKLMRLILNNSKQPLIFIEDEVAATRLYLELEQLRFEDRFSFEIAIESELPLSSLLIPPLLLQPYIENSIWHGLMHNDKKGHLKVTVRLGENQIIFQVLDNGIGRHAASGIKKVHDLHQKSYGLKMSEDRLALLSTGEQVNAQVEIIDLFDYSGIALGTLVEINLPDNLSND